MSEMIINRQSKEKLQQLLNAVKSQSSVQDDQIETADYDWHQPHYFNSAQLRKINELTKKITAEINKKFSDLYNNSYDVEIVSINQVFADSFLNEIAENKTDNYFQVMGFVENPQHQDQSAGSVSHVQGGLVCIPGKSAVIWTNELLGDNKSEQDDEAIKELSQLEVSLLSDVTSALIDSVSLSCENNGFNSLGNIAKNYAPLELYGSEELCKITLSIKKVESENSTQVAFLVFADKLKLIIGEEGGAHKASPAEVSEMVLNHVHNTPATVTAQFCSLLLSFEELMDICVGDVLLLGKGVHEPVELLIEDQPIFRGQLAQSIGKQAVVITEAT